MHEKKYDGDAFQLNVVQTIDQLPQVGVVGEEADIITSDIITGEIK